MPSLMHLRRLGDRHSKSASNGLQSWFHLAEEPIGTLSPKADAEKNLNTDPHCHSHKRFEFNLTKFDAPNFGENNVLIVDS